MENNALEFHDIATIFPLIEGQEFAELVDNVKANGVKAPIWLYEGKILDGRNRYRAAQKAGVPFQTKDFIGSQLEAIAHVWALNRTRRHLNSSQAAIADAMRDKLQRVYEKVRVAARERELSGKGDDGSGGRGNTKNPEELIPQGFRNPQTRDLRAKAAGTNAHYIDFADRLLEERPDLAEEVHSGKKTLTQVQRELKRQALISTLIEQPTGKYRVIYADPPWNYHDKCDEGAIQSGGCEQHYPSMTLPELCALPIKALAEENAVLFLWATSPLLEEAFPVIKAWGFKYKANCIWDKVRHNRGHYLSVRHELLLICTRGSCTPDVKVLYDSVQSIEKTKKHSEKPEEFRAIIDTLYPYGKRIELFARTRVKGWDSHGNEILHESAEAALA